MCNRCRLFHSRLIISSIKPLGLWVDISSGLNISFKTQQVYTVEALTLLCVLYRCAYLYGSVASFLLRNAELMFSSKRFRPDDVFVGQFYCLHRNVGYCDRSLMAGD